MSAQTSCEEISTHEPCKYLPWQVVQCVYCKPVAPVRSPASWRHQEIPPVWNIGGADFECDFKDEQS